MAAGLVAVIGNAQAIVRHEAVDILARAAYEKDVAGFYDGRSRRSFLRNVLTQALPLHYPKLEHIESIVRPQRKGAER